MARVPDKLGSRPEVLHGGARMCAKHRGRGKGAAGPNKNHVHALSFLLKLNPNNYLLYILLLVLLFIVNKVIFWLS